MAILSLDPAAFGKSEGAALCQKHLSFTHCGENKGGCVCANKEMKLQHCKSFCHIIPNGSISGHYSGNLAARKHIQCFWQEIS